MSTVKTALIGLGYWGPNLLRNFAAQEECEMVYGCDLDEKLLKKAASRYPSVTYTTNADDVFNDPEVDLVLIATPTSTHFPLAKKALETGKHVLVEKPMASSVAEAEKLVALAKKQNKLLMVDHTFVFASSVEKMVDLVDCGELGNLLYFDSTRINLGLIQKDTNVLFDLAIHDLSILSQFVDLDGVTAVAAHGAKYFGQQEEIADLHLQFNSNFRAHIQVSWLSPTKVRKTVLAGTKSMIMYDDTEPSEKVRVYDKGIDHDTTKPDPMLPKYRSGDILIPALELKETLASEAKHVLACVQGKEKPRVPGEEGAKILRILEASTESFALGGSFVSLCDACRMDQKKTVKPNLVSV